MIHSRKNTAVNFTLKLLEPYAPQMRSQNWLEYKPKGLNIFHKELLRVAYSILGADDLIVISHIQWSQHELFSKERFKNYKIIFSNKLECEIWKPIQISEYKLSICCD